MRCIVLAPILAGLPAAALAADPGTVVSLPWGDWLAAAVSWGGDAIVAVILALLARLLAILPATVGSLVKTLQVEQLLARAVDFGINAVAGAAKGRVLTADLGSQVLAEAANYAVQHGPKGIVDWMGGPAALREMILARLSLAPEASAAEILPKAGR